MRLFDFSKEERVDIRQSVEESLSQYYSDTKSTSIGRLFDPKEVKDFVDQFELTKESSPKEVINKVIQGLSEYAIQTPHPNYFGLFNPRPSYASILADYISATFNPQLASWSHAPFANEVERKCITELGDKLGFDKSSIDGAFCTGGAESNLTGLLCALNNKYHNLASDGIIGIKSRPIIYISSEAHHSIHRAAKVTGLGTNVIRTIKANEDLEMDIDDLKRNIQNDIVSGHQPLMVVATTGTTGAGAIDNVKKIYDISKEHDLWLHVDAAYGAGLKISPKYGPALGAVHLGDSITIDLHKWFSVPMGASVIIVKDKNILKKAFAIRTDYMPLHEKEITIDPYSNSIQWSRRAIGLKFFLPLAIHGWKGYEKTITHQIEMGHYLRDQLKDSNWIITNNSPMPIVCFTQEKLKGNPEKVNTLVDRIIESGKAWCSAYPVNGQLSIRACITNYATTEAEIDEFVALLSNLL